MHVRCGFLELARRWRDGDRHAGDELARRLRPMVYPQAKRYATPHCPLADLVQEGLTAAVMEAPFDYDESRGRSFSSWAVVKALSAMRHYRRDQGEIVRRPACAQEAGIPPIMLLPLPLPNALQRWERMADPADALIDNLAAQQQADRYLGWTSGMARETLRLGWLGFDSHEIGTLLGRTAREIQHHRGSAQWRLRARAERVGERIGGGR